MNLGPATSPTVNERGFRRLSYLLVFLMMACGAMTIGHFIRNVAPSWHSGIIAAVLLFIVLDRLLTYQSLKSLAPLSSEWAIAIGAQWIVISLFLRLLLSFADGLASFRRELSLFALGSLLDFFTLEFVFSLLFALLAWYLTGHFLDLLDEIGLDQAMALQENPVLVQSDTIPARNRLVNLVFSLGIALVILTTMARLNLGTAFSKLEGIPQVELNRVSGGEAGALLYFVFGFALLSLVRLLSLQTRWALQRIPVSSANLTRQWVVYSLVFLMMLAVIVSLLPAGDSLGFFPVLRTLLGFLFGILFFIGQLFLFLIGLLFSLPLLLMRGEPLSTAPEPPPLPVLPPTEPAVPSAPNETWMLIRSVLLWGALLVIVIYASIQFVRQHGGIRAALSGSRLANWLVLAWQWLYRNVDRTRGTLSRAIAEGWQSIRSRMDGKRILPRPGFLSLRSLDPRRQVFFYYLAMLRRGGEQGLPRKPAQTPAEYAVQLEKALPTAGEDIDAITAAFVRARYSRQEVDSRMVERIKATWGRIRRALQDKPKTE